MQPAVACQLNGQPASTYHTIQAMDARGNIVNEELGNGVTRSATYEHNTGLLQNLQASLGVSTFQHLDLQWDEVGNLEQRKETGNGRNLTENFLYDGLNRLTSSQVVGSSAQTLTYNAIGNITHKSDVGSYSYGAGNAGPHAVTSAGGQTYAYDANGNNISGDGRTISYTSFDKPSQIIKGSHKVEFEYGPDRSRYRRTDTNTGNGRVTDTLYIGSVEKITNPDGSKEWKRTIGNIVIKQVFNSSGTQTAKTEHYILKDHLGSPSVIMDKVAQVQQTMDFDPWGARRNTNWAAMSSTELTNTFFKNHSVSNSVGTDSLTSRGFTGHEMLDEVGVIHMNGRIYDAKLGRFLQADPLIQNPYSTQSLNRYSYTNNNPLNATDPSGFSFWKKFGSLLAGIAGFFICGPACAGIAAGAVTYAQTGSLKAAIIVGVSTFAFANIGSGFVNSGASILSKAGAIFVTKMAVIGGITATLSGGKFGHGFASAGLTAFIGGAIAKGTQIGNALKTGGRAIARVIAGGTVSKFTGGKFANGAATAAFSWAVQAGVEEISVGEAPTGGTKEIEAVRKQALEKIDAMITDIAAAQAGNVGATSHLQKYFGKDADLAALATEYAEIRSEFASATIVPADPAYIAKRAKAGVTVGAYVHQSKHPDTIFYNPALIGRKDFAALLVHEGAHLAGNGHFKIKKNIQYGSRLARKLARSKGFSATSQNSSNYSCAIYMTRDC